MGGCYYKVDMSGHNIGLSWGSAYSTSKVFLGSGNDVLIGGAGRDKLIGGSGNDEFRIGDTAETRKQADVILDFGNGDDTLSFGNHVETVYVKRTGKDTILKNGTGADAEIYAVLKNYTDPLTAYDAEDGVVFVDIV